MPKIKIPRDRDNDDDSLRTPCFQIGEDVQLKDIPTTGEEFLLKVMNERKHVAAVTRCNIDVSQYKSNQSRFVEEVPIPITPDFLKPTIEWQNIQVADFSDIRLYISRMVAKKDQWSNKIEKMEIVNDTLKEWKTFFSGREPTLSCVLGLHASLIDRGLEMLVKILQNVNPGDSVDRKTGQWIYAFLACLKQPLLSDSISILRDLARQCAQIRSSLDVDDEGVNQLVAPLNIFICLVGRYFRQHDLAD